MAEPIAEDDVKRLLAASDVEGRGFGPAADPPEDTSADGCCSRAICFSAEDEGDGFRDR